MDDDTTQGTNDTSADLSDSEEQKSVEPAKFLLPDENVESVSGVESGHTTHLTAEDIDLIEKEWVDKAKQIVEMTQGDPYKQTIELNKAKADYIKKRYNKVIKLNEDS